MFVFHICSLQHGPLAKVEQSTEQVLKKGLALCSGFTDLMEILLTIGGVENKIIFGYLQGQLLKPQLKSMKANHSWNVVKLLGRWYFLDTVLASGYIDHK